MKRKNNLYENICSLENLYAAERIARRGKTDRDDIVQFHLALNDNILAIHRSLVNHTWRTSVYKTFMVWEPKERQVYWLPYEDQVVHHAVMLVIGPMFDAMFTKDTYSCIKGRGIHAASYALRSALTDVTNTVYCLKIDIKKFYPSVDHDILKALLRRKIKDTDLLNLLDEIIDSAVGLPIGNYLSIYFGNFYLSYFDHWLKEDKQVANCFRYTDDIVILGPDKPYLHALLADIRSYLTVKLKLTIKKNYQVFPVAARGIDFVGYPTYHTHVRLRKSIKKRLFKMLATRPNKQSIASYMGWLKHCNSLNLIKKISHEKIQRSGSAINAVRRQNRSKRHIGAKANSPIIPHRPEQTGPGQTVLNLTI